jgi:aminoglycoside phosphotransferase (APT) family kinase protein
LPDGPLNQAPDPEKALLDAAAWIGTFHALTEGLVEAGGCQSLNSYGLDYFEGWAARTATYADHWHHEFPWIADVCRNFHSVVPEILAEPVAVVHGEYYPQNVLVHDGRICPVDWESAAIGAGEIDLASLTDRWPDALATACASSYSLARWNLDTPPPGFNARLQVARIYFLLRWL